MICRALSDPIWEQLQNIMKKKRAVKVQKIITISWKLFYGNYDCVNPLKVDS